MVSVAVTSLGAGLHRISFPPPWALGHDGPGPSPVRRRFAALETLAHLAHLERARAWGAAPVLYALESP